MLRLIHWKKGLFASLLGLFFTQAVIAAVPAPPQLSARSYVLMDLIVVRSLPAKILHDRVPPLVDQIDDRLYCGARNCFW